MKERLKVAYAPVLKSSWLNDRLEGIRAKSLDVLRTFDVDLIEGPLMATDGEAAEFADLCKAEQADCVLIHYLTFSLGSMTPLLAQRVGKPVILWGMPEPPFDGGRIKSNSFCAVNMNSHALRKLQYPYSYVYGYPEDINEDMARQFRVLGCVKRLQTTKIGVVGSRVPGFYTSCFNELELRRQLGVEINYIDLLEIVDAAEKLSDEDAEAAYKHITGAACACDKVPEEQLRKGARLYGAFMALKEKTGVAGFAVKCWPQIGDIYGIGVCSTLGQLTSEGIVAACEGDVYGAVAMVILQELSGAAPFYCDLIAFEDDENVGLGWHCGAAPVSLCAGSCSSALGLHSVMDGGNVKGITHDFPLKPGPVTFTQLGEDLDGSYRFLIANGQGLDTKQMLPGNPLRIRFDAPIKTVRKDIIEGGFSHHYTVGYAALKDDLTLLCKWLGIKPVLFE